MPKELILEHEYEGRSSLDLQSILIMRPRVQIEHLQAYSGPLLGFRSCACLRGTTMYDCNIYVADSFRSWDTHATDFWGGTL